MFLRYPVSVMPVYQYFPPHGERIAYSVCQDVFFKLFEFLISQRWDSVLKFDDHSIGLLLCAFRKEIQ